MFKFVLLSLSDGFIFTSQSIDQSARGYFYRLRGGNDHTYSRTGELLRGPKDTGPDRLEGVLSKASRRTEIPTEDVPDRTKR